MSLIDYIANGDNESIRYSIEQGTTDVDGKNSIGNTNLMIACFFGNLNVVKYLVKHNADLHIQNDYGHTCFHWASRSGHLEIVKYLLKTNKIFIDHVDNYGCTALYFACQNNCLDVAVYLVNNGARIDVKNGKGHNILCDAKKTNHVEIVEYLTLIEFETTTLYNLIELNDLQNFSAALENLYSTCSSTVGFKHFSDVVNRCLVKSAKHNKNNFVSYFIKKNVNINAIDSFGNTCLIWATVNENADLIKYLLQLGADISIKNVYGQSAKMLTKTPNISILFEADDLVDIFGSVTI